MENEERRSGERLEAAASRMDETRSGPESRVVSTNAL